MAERKTVIAAALGECVHVAGVMNFLRLAEAAGWQTVFLGPAAPIERVLEAAQEHGASLVGVSYRLTPETGERLLVEFAEAADDMRTAGVRFAFGGTPPVAERAAAIGFFERVFDGSESTEEVLAYLRGWSESATRDRLSANAGGAYRVESALSASAPSLRSADRGAHAAGHRADRRRTRAGRDLVGRRPGRAGELLPPGATGPATDRRRRRAGAQRR